MTPNFTISVDRNRGLLSIELAGFFSASDVSSFNERRQAAHRELTCAPHKHVTLVDVTACQIQAQEVIGAFASILSDPRYTPHRIAFVVGSSLAKLQVRRVLEGHHAAQCFQDRPSAEAWLAE